MRIALAQLNATVGDFRANVDRMVHAAQQAVARGAQVIAFPELSLPGYPPRDLVEKPSFLDRNAAELERLAQQTADLDITLICGYASRSEHPTGKRALNSAAVIEHGQIVFRQHKTLLPTYDVFDEARYFHPADKVELFTLRGKKVALTKIGRAHV